MLDSLFNIPFSGIVEYPSAVLRVLLRYYHVYFVAMHICIHGNPHFLQYNKGFNLWH